MRTNALSMIGRMNYTMVWMFYPAAFAYYSFVHCPKTRKAEEDSFKEQLENQTKDVSVDPDCFNPFSALPFHNNPELKYMYANTKMAGFVDGNQLNVENYFFKGYHDSYDHGNKKQHLYNWVSVGVNNH